MPTVWPPSWLTDAEQAEGWRPGALVRIRATLDWLGHAELELRPGSLVCIVDSPHCTSTDGRSLLAAIEGLLEREVRYRKRGGSDQGIAKAAKPRLAARTTRKPPPGRR
jgi:hypothetical protein